MALTLVEKSVWILSGECIALICEQMDILGGLESPSNIFTLNQSFYQEIRASIFSHKGMSEVWARGGFFQWREKVNAMFSFWATDRRLQERDIMTHLRFLSRQTVGSLRAFSEVYVRWKSISKLLKQQEDSLVDVPSPTSVCLCVCFLFTKSTLVNTLCF